MDYTLLADLLPYLEAFEKTEQSNSVSEFITWLQKVPSLEGTAPRSKSTAISMNASIDIQITHLLALSHKYVRFLYKKGFKQSLLQTTEDFGFLATLYHFGDLRKNELIQANTSEFTSGMEVIRRLERNGLIESFLDEEDRRARRVQLTKQGLEIFHRALPTLASIGEIATGPLTNAEKKRLLELLHKLNDFHNPIFHDRKDDNLTDILEQHVND
ncbi:MAG: MarR family winged helix-turn-helix transcriptional regulator [Aureispira sp.]